MEKGWSVEKKGKVIIGISGKAGAGKDTIADHLCKNYGFVQYRFATPIKKISANTTGTTLEDNLNKKSFIPKISFGELEGYDLGKYQQEIWKMYRENLCSDIWVRILMQDVKTSTSKRIVISDMRFINEANTIKKMEDRKVLLIRIERREELRIKYLGSRKIDDVSETELDDYPYFDIHIENNGTFDDLYEKIYKFIKLKHGIKSVQK